MDSLILGFDGSKAFGFWGVPACVQSQSFYFLLHLDLKYRPANGAGLSNQVPFIASTWDRIGSGGQRLDGYADL